MKTIRYIAMLLLIFSAMKGYSQDKPASMDSTISFKVFGVCVLCKERIEGALKIKGVGDADWNIDTKMLTVSYNSSKISLEKMNTKIAAAGHDTYLKKAKNSVYEALPKCCHYREIESMEEMVPDKDSTSTVTIDTSSFIIKSDSILAMTSKD